MGATGDPDFKSVDMIFSSTNFVSMTRHGDIQTESSIEHCRTSSWLWEYRHTRKKYTIWMQTTKHHYLIYIGGLQSRCAVATRISTKCLARSKGYSHIVILSPNESAIPCVLLRILTCPIIVPASVFSMLKLARASSPVVRFPNAFCQTRNDSSIQIQDHHRWRKE